MQNAATELIILDFIYNSVMLKMGGGAPHLFGLVDQPILAAAFVRPFTKMVQPAFFTSSVP